MNWKICFALVICMGIITIAQPVRSELTDQAVRQSIERGVTFLLSQQNKTSGAWVEHSGYPGGLSALCTLALLNSGVEVDTSEIQQALNYLRSFDQPKMVYSTALRTMVLCLAEPEVDRLQIRRNVEWLESIQIRDSERQGSWGYSGTQGRGDNSNAQFALLALHEAERIGIEVQEQTWELALDYWTRTQQLDGSWAYLQGQPSSGSMTCAGLASVVIASGKTSKGDARVIGNNVKCCSEQEDLQTIERAFDWLSQKFTVNWNPSSTANTKSAARRGFLLYYLYGVERIGRLTGQRFIGDHDWYREGAEMLVASQEDFQGLWQGVGHAENNPLVATSFALLFLSKGRRPIVLSKLKHGKDNDWNRHRAAVQNLTRRIEGTWQRDLTWQTIDLAAATLESLVQTPVLFISGRDQLEFSEDQKTLLRQYIEQGGFIFAESTCGGRNFDRQFRALMSDLFPRNSLTLLPTDHPIWYAEGKVNPRFVRPLLGINACCRTSVVYCPEDLSCYWELSQGSRTSTFPQTVQEEIKACLQIGENVVAYATNRQLKAKLDARPLRIAEEEDAGSTRGMLVVPKILHTGGSDDAPHSLSHLLREVRSQTKVRLSTTHPLLPATDKQLLDYPIAFMHGRRSFRFSAQERKALEIFVKRGGFLFADSICASPQFTQSFRREMEAIFPAHPLRRISAKHPMFSGDFRGYKIGNVQLRDPQMRGKEDRLDAKIESTTPFFEALEINDRIAVIFSPYDMSCALEQSASLECKGYLREDAMRLGVNVILFAIQQ